MPESTALPPPDGLPTVATCRGNVATFHRGRFTSSGGRETGIMSRISRLLLHGETTDPGGTDTRKSPAIDRASDVSLGNRAFLRASKSTLGAMKHPVDEQECTHCMLKSETQ